MKKGEGMVSSPVAIIRADASPAIGGGHIARCLVLARSLVECGYSVVFWCNRGALTMRPELAAYRCVFVETPEDTTHSPIEEDADLLVIDHYGWDTTREKACRAWAGQILVLDDMADRERDADILLNQNAGFRLSDYEGLTPSKCRFLIGPQFALLREEFAQLASRTVKNVRNGPVRSVLVCFGAGDQEAMLDIALPVLERHASGASLTIVGGSEAQQCADYAGCDDWNFVPHIDDMVGALAKNDIAIGAGGVSMLERCVLGIPAITAIVAENQHRPAVAAEAAGATLAVDFRETKTSRSERMAAFEKAFLRLLAEPELRQTLATCGQTLCDGKGAARIKEEGVKWMEQ